MAKLQSTIDTGGVLRARPEGTGRVIQDRSAEIMAGAVSDTIGAVAGVVEAEAIGGLESDIEQGLTDFASAKQDTDLYSKLTAAAESLDKTENGVDTANITEATDEFNKLNRMVKLGNMSSAQAKLLAEDKLRRAVNNSPFHRDALIAAHDTILGIHRNELAAIASLDKAKASNNASLLKVYQKEAIKYGIPVIGKSVDQLAAEVTPIKGNEAAWARIEQGEKIDSNQALNTYYGDSNNALKGAYSSYQQELNVIKEQYLASPDKSIEEFTANIQSLENRYTTNLTQHFGRFIEQSAMKAGIDSFTRAREIVENSVKTDESTKLTDNKLKQQQNNLQSDALKNPSMQAAYVLNKLTPDFITTSALFSDSGALAIGLTNYVKDLASGQVVQQSAGTTPASRHITKAAGDMIRKEIAEDNDRFPEETNSFYTTINNMADVVSQRTFSTEEMQNVLDTGAMPEIAKLSQNPDFTNAAESLRKGTERVLAKVLIPNIVSKINYSVKGSTLPAIAGGDTSVLRDVITLDISPTGLIRFKAKDSNLSTQEMQAVEGRVSELNRIDAVNINKAVRTLAHVNGSTDYLSATQAVLQRSNLAILPDLSGSILIEEEDAPEAGTLAAMTDIELRAIANNPSNPQRRDAVIELYDREEDR